MSEPSAFEPPQNPPPPPSENLNQETTKDKEEPTGKKNHRELTALTGFVIFILYFAGQIIGAFLAGIVAGMAAIVVTRSGEQSIEEYIVSLMPAIMIIAVLSGILGLLFGARIVKNSLKETDGSGAAWTVGSFRDCLLGCFLGAGVALISISCYGILIQVLGFGYGEKGTFSQMVSGSNWGLIAWIFLALITAPPSEEMLFRGILFGGMNRSWGIVPAFIISNLIFVGMHFAEAINFWPTFLGIMFFSIVATILRLKMKSIGPAVCAHFFHNLVFVIVVSFSLVKF